MKNLNIGAPKSAADLWHMQSESPKYIVPGLIGEGIILLAGRPMIGKSWLALDVAIAVATGGECLKPRSRTTALRMLAWRQS
jgi:RecA-family ATPase